MAGNNTIGRYQLLRRVGAGGMGIVYEALDTRDESRVALKVLLPHAAEENDGILRFKREFRALARLRHPNIVRVLDAGIENDVPFIVMEFIDGKDVRRHLRNLPEGAVRDREMRRLLRQIFGALAHIHVRRIVHRDLKPENILVTTDGRLKLMDFGVARLLRAPTSNSGLLGTFAYMAPEQVTGGDMDGRADLYAIGVLIYELLVGEYPFPVEPPAAALHHHVHTQPPRILDAHPKVDPELAALAHKLLEKDPLNRLQTAEEAFRYLTDGEPAGASVDTQLPAQLFAPRFVGRSVELEQLERLATDLEAGRGGLALVEGPSGIGKSRLIQELKTRMKRRMNVLVAACASDRTQAYLPIQTVLDEVETIATRSSSEVVKKIVGRDAALVSAVSPRLARLGGYANTEHLDASERKVRLHKAIVGVLGRLALTRPVVLVIEDVHWADSATLELIWDASRTLLAQRPGAESGQTVCPVAIILTRRSLAEGADHSEHLVRRFEERGLLRISMGAIETDAVIDMVRTMTGVQRPIQAAVDELARATRGRPLMVQEVLESWVQDRVLVRQRGVWSFRDQPLETAEDAADRTTADPPPAPPPLPHKRAPLPSSDEVALAKLERISPAGKLLLQRLALLGRLLSAELVAAVSALDEDQFLDTMDELVRANLLQEDVSHDGVQYRFYHEGFREAVTRALDALRKSELHRGIASNLERHFRSRRQELAEVLARHWRAAGAPNRAIRHLVAAAKTAGARGDLDAAQKRLAEARGLLDDCPRTPASNTRRVRLLLVEIELLLDFGRARDALERADPEVAATTRAPEVMAAELSLARAAALFALGRLDETLATLAKLEPPTRSLWARAGELEGRARMARGEHREAATVFEFARDTARAAGLEALERSLALRIGVVRVQHGDLDQASEQLEDGLAWARARGQTDTVVELIGHLGLVHAARGSNTEAMACFREALELAEARGVKAELSRWSGELGKLLTERGELEPARARLQQALELAREIGSRQAEVMWRGELGVHHFVAKRLDRAAAELVRCLALARELGFRRYEGCAQIYLGAVALERDLEGLDEAEDRIGTGLELARDLGDAELEVAALLQLVPLRRAQGDPDRAARALEDAGEVARAARRPHLEQRVDRAR